MRTTSSSSCTAPRTTSTPCAKTSPRCSHRWGCGCHAAKTRVVHMSDGFDFLGFRIQWRRKRGTNKWYVYTFIADRPIRSLKAKIRALTHRTSQQDLEVRADQAQPDHARLGQLLPARRRQAHLQHAGPLRLVAGDPDAEARCTAGGGRTSAGSFTDPDGRWQPISGGRDRTVRPRGDPGHPVPLPRQHDPQPLAAATTPDGRNRGEPVAWRDARRVRRAARGNGPGAMPAPRPRPTRSGQFRAGSFPA